MFRSASTTSTGTGFSPAVIGAVWAKGAIVTGYDANRFRKDACGAWMASGQYGQTTDYGWEIDHVHPVARCGADELGNLQPLHWRNNRGKGDDYPHWTCSISSTR